MFKPCRSLLVPCICFFTIVKSQNFQRDGDILYWTKNRLTFADFRGKPSQEDTTSRLASPKMLTHKLGSIIQSINVHFEPLEGKTVFIIQAAMKRNLSWLKDYTDTLLKHEQGHFDICEIYARILRREIQKAESLDEAKEIYNKVSADEESEQDNYDQHNTYQSGGITLDWSKKIISRLQELEPHSNPVVILAIDK